MPISETSAVERIARVFAARLASVNADGDDPSAAKVVDAAWPAHVADAVSVLKVLREPDKAMAAAGDADVWERMILRALAEAD